jgi:uncharacterized protein (TIGR03435 family)
MMSIKAGLSALLLVGWIGMAVMGERALAQGVVAERHSFEVASIRPHENAEDSSVTNLLPGGRYEGKNVSIRKMMRQALGVDDPQMLGAPDWVDTARYDIEARTGDTGKLEVEEFQRLLLTLLEDRFQFRFHRETRERPVYWLVVEKGGDKLKRDTGKSRPTMSVNGSGARKVLEARAVSMGEFVSLLPRQAGRPVEDHTGLKGSYDVKLEWDESQATDSALPSLFGAIEEQLGLKLKPAKGKVDVITVDHVERPSEN